MNHDLELLYVIFDYVFPSSFTKEENFVVRIGNSTTIGHISADVFDIYQEFSDNLLSKIKQAFSLDELSDDDVKIILQNLSNWLQTKRGGEFKIITIFNNDTGNSVWFFNYNRRPVSSSEEINWIRML